MAEVSLKFDGLNLTAVDVESGRVIRAWAAISGRPGKQSPDLVNLQEIGPIPSGSWSISTSEIIHMSDLPLWRQLLSEIGAVSPRGGVSSWGNTFVSIKPSGNTVTFGRRGFNIHGGSEAGSAGCIDLVGGNDSFFDFIGAYNGKIPLIVDYSGNETKLKEEIHPLLTSNAPRLNELLNGPEAYYILSDQCFLPPTPILLADGITKPIEAIRPEDRVMTYDKRGALVPSRVTRVFVNDVAHVLDFHGTGVTPGHVFLCGAGRFQGRHVPLLDILRDDGAVVRQDGRKSRNRHTKERACRPFRRQRLIAAYANVLGSKATGLRLPAPVARCSKDFAR